MTKVVCWCRLKVNPNPSYLLLFFIMIELMTFGKEGMVYNRGRKIVLENERSGEHVAVKVVQYDSVQGWVAENGDGDWQWYHEKENNKWPEGTEFWKYIKKVGT